MKNTITIETLRTNRDRIIRNIKGQLNDDPTAQPQMIKDCMNYMVRMIEKNDNWMNAAATMKNIDKLTRQASDWWLRYEWKPFRTAALREQFEVAQEKKKFECISW